MDLKNVKVVASYEARLVCRSFNFWILFLLAVGGISLWQWLIQGKVTLSSWSWLMHHQTFSFPLVNAYLYNIVQAFFVIFLVTNLFFRERRGETIASLHARPVSNGEYLLGKTVGIIFVLLSVGFFSLLVCCGMNIWGSQAPFNPLYYLYYFLTLTIPSLVFFTGFALWITWLTRSRALSMLLLLVFLYCSVAILPGVFHGLFDFSGSTLSNVFSVATGHVEGWNYLLHRLAYLLAGIGLICWTIRLQERLPNERRIVIRFSYSGIILLFIGILLGGIYASGFVREKSARAEYRAAFVRHDVEESCRVSQHSITFRQAGDRIISASELTLRNPNNKPVSRLVLYLNPGLEVECLEERGKSLAFTRDAQVVVVERFLAAGDSVHLFMRYSGVPDGRIAYLDLEDAAYYDTKRGNNFFHLGRRHVLVSDASLILVPEVMWYPVTVPPVNPSFPFLSGSDYTFYRLQVVAPVQPVVLSQGERRRQGDTLQFLPSRPLEGISLCAGDYEHKTINLQDILVDWYYFKGHDFVTPIVKQFDEKELLGQIGKDVLMNLGKIASFSIYDSGKVDSISDFMVRRDWYSGEGSRLQLVETPLPFVSHARVWKGRSEYIQPGMVLLGERGVGMDMSAYTYFLKKDEKQAEESIRLIMGARFVTIPFLSQTSAKNMSNPFWERLNPKAYTSRSAIIYPYCCLPLFLEPSVTITSSRYWTIDRILKQFIAKGKDYSTKSYSRIKREIITDNSDLAAHFYLQDHTLEEAAQDPSVSPYVLQKMVDLKMVTLLDQVAVYVSQGKFYHFLRSFYTTHCGEVPLDTLCYAIQSSLGFDFNQVLQTWGSQAATSFRVQDLKVERVELGYGRGSMAHFQIWNAGKHPGFIVYSFYPREFNYLLLQPGECKEVHLLGYSNTFTLDLGISCNLPSVMRVTEAGTTRDTMERIQDISPSVFEPKLGEIVVDNEDPGFRLILPKAKWFDLFFKKKSYSRNDGGMILTGPWRKEFAGKYYGNEYRSVYQKRAENGSSQAEWSADIPEDGIYEIFVMCPDIVFYIPEVQYYTVSGEGLEAKEIMLPWEKGEWASLGQFELKQGKSFVVLNDRSPKEEEKEKDKPHFPSQTMTVADAVKWVKVKAGK
ncbi:ABC transporter permease [Butyricimonas synergistica]|uniref:golvesin C-terminal-like domain-containing protein n=1 Tax=Butyricimonas synergistica TaxID=544644 RepID=UPI00035FF531|nr:ABC transporter permease [Butyricimonas synergistica]